MISQYKENFFSIIIPHLNEGYYLDIMLDSIFTYFKYTNFEIIIVDDGSTDIDDLNFCYNHILKDKIKLFKRNSLGIAKAKNFGASIAEGDVLCFFDGHMYFNTDILAIINKLFNTYLEIDLLQPKITSHNNKSVEGNIYKINDLSLNSGWSEINFNNNMDIYETPNVIGAATIIKKSIFNKIGGFNQFFEVWGSEDLEFSMRAWLLGYKSFLTNKILVSHFFKDKSKFNYNMKIEYIVKNKLIFLFTCFKNDKIINIILENLKKEYGNIVDSEYKKILLNKKFWTWQKKEINKYQNDEIYYFNKFSNYYNNFTNL